VSEREFKDATPTLQKAIESTPKDPRDVQFAIKALDALAKFKPDGFIDRAMAIALDTGQNPSLRGKAFDIVGHSPSAPAAKVQAAVIEILKDPDGNNILRNKATGVLESPRFANAEAWAVLDEVLMREQDDPIIQRGCLRAMFKSAPLDRVRQTLQDRRVYTHPFFGIRSDVATGLAALNARDKISLEIMCTYLLDNDPKDVALLVPQEAYLTLWVLTGHAYGIQDKTLFPPGRNPRPITDEQAIRANLGNWTHLRVGINAQQVEAVQRVICSNIDEVRKKKFDPAARPIRQRRVESSDGQPGLKAVARHYREKIQYFMDLWADQAKAAGDDKKKDIAPQGPGLPDKGG
jgi:hypothetical protein